MLASEDLVYLMDRANAFVNSEEELPASQNHSTLLAQPRKGTNSKIKDVSIKQLPPAKMEHAHFDSQASSSLHN